MKRLIFMTSFIILITSGLVNAETLKGGYEICMTKEQLTELAQHKVKRDQQGYEYLMKEGMVNGCGISKAGVRVSVLDGTWSGAVKVRIYFGNDSATLWTFRENIQE